MDVTATDPLANPNATTYSADPPGGDTPFAELFDENGSDQAQQTTAPSQPAAQPAPAAPAAPEFVLKTSTGSVYKSVEDAQRGIEEKDNLIKQLRDRYRTERGIDPITNEPVQSNQNLPANYARDPGKYVKDLADAVTKNDPNVYAQTQAKFVMDLLEPIAPIIQDFARSKALTQVESEYKDFRQFRESPEFSKVMDSSPVLKNAIQGAEQDIRYASQLPELYKLAYAQYQQARMPELIKQAAAQAQATAPAAPQTRPTLTPGTPTPTAPIGNESVAELLRTPEGRKKLMDDARSRGLDNLAWTGANI